MRRNKKGTSPPSVSAPLRSSPDRANVALTSENDMNTPTNETLLPWRRVRERVGLGRTTCYRLQRLEGERAFPKPIRLSPGRVGWKESEINAWIEAQAAKVRA